MGARGGGGVEVFGGRGRGRRERERERAALLLLLLLLVLLLLLLLLELLLAAMVVVLVPAGAGGSSRSGLLSNTNAADRGTTAKEAKKREIMLCGLVHDVKTDISVPRTNNADRKCRPGIQTSLPSCKPDRDPALESIGVQYSQST